MMRTDYAVRFEVPVEKPTASLCALLACLGMWILLGTIELSRADEFGRLEGAPLFDIPTSAGIRTPAALSYRDLEALPGVLAGERAAFVIVKSDLGNLSKILVSGGFKKLTPADEGAASVPILILERFETIKASDRRSFSARGRGVTLFDGFQFDLDTGQVVPDGAGGDIRFTASGPSEPRLTTVGASRFYVLEKPLVLPAVGGGKPSSGRAVLPGDFRGRFDLVADGQWSGRLDLAVDAQGAVTGFFRSEKNGSTYPVSGKAGDGGPQRIRFEVRFPRANQSYDGLIWSEGKNVIAGTVTMLDHPYSFVAIREGTSLRLSDDTYEAAPAPPSAGAKPSERKPTEEKHAADR
jgi:hypothetical protein